MVTISPGTPFNALTGLSATQMANCGPQPKTPVRALFIQMLHGGTGRGIVMDGIYGFQADGISPRIPSASTPTDVTAELAAATATAPGQNYTDACDDISRIWVDGTVSGDTVKVSYATIEQ